jgi:DNA-directed RNA polymerase specialized sigma24 family protein
VPPLPLQGDEESLFAEHRVTLRRRVGRLVNTSDANVDASCSFAWMQLVRRQPRRETVLSWLTTVAVREAVRLDRRDRRDRRLVSSEDLPDRCRSLTHAEAFAALEVVASLPPRQRELIGLQVAGYSREEIAVLTGTSKPRGRTPPAPGARRIARRLGRATGAQALGLAPLLSVQPVSYQGRLVAGVAGGEIVLSPRIAELEDDHPRRRFVVAMFVVAMCKLAAEQARSRSGRTMTPRRSGSPGPC